jgi:hypothetical protein
VLIEGSRIAAVGPNLSAADAVTIDASNMIVTPGFIDTHQHAWEGILRNIATDCPLEGDGGNPAFVLKILAPVYTGMRLGSVASLSRWGRRRVGKVRHPMQGKNIWRLCKLYGRLIGYPELRPHALRHGVAVEVLEQRHDLEEVRALLGHTRIDTTQIYTRIRPPQLKRTVAFYEAHDVARDAHRY